MKALRQGSTHELDNAETEKVSACAGAVLAGPMTRLFCWGGLLLGILWILKRLLSNNGCILDDEWSHYLFSRSVWQNPEMILDGWTRPGRNLMHIWVAPFGITASRLFTLGMALLGLGVTWRVGRLLELRALWALPVLYLFQAWMPELSYPVLTQTPFLLVWILACWLGMKGRWHLAGLCFGYLSLIRHEGILLTGLWGIWVTCQEGGFVRGLLQRFLGARNETTIGKSLIRDAWYAVSTIGAILAYNLISWVWVGELPFALYFESKPTEIYGSGPIWHYVPLLLAGLGLFSTLLGVIGLFGLSGRWRPWSLLLLMYPAYFLMHSLIYWRGAFASGGYYHFLMPMAPFFALLGVRAIDIIGGFISVRPWRRVGSTVLLLLVLLQGLRMDQRQMSNIDWRLLEAQDKTPGFKLISDTQNLGLIAGPLKADFRQQCLFLTSDKLAEKFPESQVYSSHIGHDFRRDNLETKEHRDRKNWGLDDWPVGTFFIWDEHYAGFHGLRRWNEFASRPEWKLVGKIEKRLLPEEIENEGDRYVVAVFRKVSLPFENDELTGGEID